MVVGEEASDVYVEDPEDIVEEFSLPLEESEQLYPCGGIDRDRKLASAVQWQKMGSLEEATLTFYHMNKCPFSGPIKLLLAHRNFKYTDVGIRYSDWLLMREELITARVPALRIQHYNGKLEWMTEANAIMRCLGEQYNLLGRTDMDKFYCDRIIGKIQESGYLLQDYFKYRKYHQDDEDDHKAYKEKFFNEISVILADLDRMLVETKGEYAASSDVTIADFYLLDFIDFLRANKPECLEPYPSLNKWRKYLMDNNQSIARYTASRSWLLI
nr:glutathione S transferase [Hymenolepis microstoma]